MPSVEIMRKCFTGKLVAPEKKREHALSLPVDEALSNHNRVLAVSSLSKRMDSSTRFAISLSARHLTAYGHGFDIELRQDEYRNGRLQLGSLLSDRIWQVELLLKKLRLLQKEKQP